MAQALLVPELSLETHPTQEMPEKALCAPSLGFLAAATLGDAGLLPWEDSTGGGDFFFLHGF